METTVDISAINSFDESVEEMVGPGGSIQQAGEIPIAATVQHQGAGAGAGLVGPVTLTLTPVAMRRHQVTARRAAGGEVVAVDTIDLGRAGQRQRLTRQVLEKLDLAEPDAMALEDELDQALLGFTSAPTMPTGPADAAAQGPEFMAIDGAKHPELEPSWRPRGCCSTERTGRSCRAGAAAVRDRCGSIGGGSASSG